MTIYAIVSLVLMSILIVVELLSIATHMHLFQRKRKKIAKNMEITKEIREDLSNYLAEKSDIERHDRLFVEIMQRIDEISAQLNAKK